MAPYFIYLFSKFSLRDSCLLNLSFFVYLVNKFCILVVFYFSKNFSLFLIFPAYFSLF